jgi:hypothetical protein
MSDRDCKKVAAEKTTCVTAFETADI